LARHSGRTLDPSTAVRFAGQQLQPTVYAGSRLLVRPTANVDAILSALTAAAEEHHLDIDVNDLDERLVRLAREAGIGPDEPQPLVLRVELLPRFDDGPVAPPDAWPVLQSYRNRFAANRAERAAVQLDHLITSHSDHDAGIHGNPYWQVPGTSASTGSANGNGPIGTPYWQVPSSTTGTPYWQVPSELAQYAAPGWGGRTPVSWVGPQPTRTPEDQLGGRRRPVVAILDTGVGDHPWLPDEIVDRNPYCAGLPIGITDPTTDPENPHVSLNPLVGSLDPTAGHGTFIAGLIRQTCPDADILAVRVIQGDGIVSEADLLEALNMLWLRQKLAILGKRSDQLIDLVSMSLGYYHEDLGDEAFDPLLLAPLRALAKLGVTIVTSAGNDATVRPMYPAAFSPWSDGPIARLSADELPIVAVGATNPDGSIAMFSNAGPWVRVYRPGASLVSTLPAFDASRTPTLELTRSGPHHSKTVRSTIDPDDFRSGFGLWSGTSFSAPILVGEVAQFMNSKQVLARADVDPAAALDRGWEAISALVPSLARPAPEPVSPRHRPSSLSPATPKRNAGKVDA
jgi:Subtilase family